jgi:hypothetical protein
MKSDPEDSAVASRPPLPEFFLRWLPTALFILIPGILVYSSVGSGQFLSGTDLLGGFYHLRGAVAKALSEGRLPLWEPHVMAGFPLFAAVHSAVFYPPAWLSIFMPIGSFWTLSVFLHLVFAGVFARAWLNRGLGIGDGGATVGGLLFLMSGYVVSHIYGGHTNHVWAYPWIPALLWRLERYLSEPTLRRGVLLGAVLALLFLAGIPPYVFYVGLIVLARLVHFVLGEREGRKDRAKRAAWGVGWLALGLLFCAPQLLPTLELIGEGQRVAVNNYEFVTSFSVAPANLLTLVAPTFFGDGREVPVWAHGYVWESQGFVGIAGLGLAALGTAGRHRQRFLWAGTAVVAVLLALGRYSPVFQIFYHVVPGASLFRVPARYLLLFTLAVTALAAMGFDRLMKGDETLRRHGLRLAGVAGAGVLLAAGFWLALRSGDGPGWWNALVDRERIAYKAEQELDAPPASRAMAAGSLLWAALCAAGVAGSLLLRRGPSGAAILGLLLVGELWVYNSRYFVGHATADMEWPADFVSNVRSHPRFPFRIATVTPAQTPAIGLCQGAGLDHVGGFDPMMIRRYTELANVARGKPPTDLVVVMALARPSPLFDLLGARYWIVPGPKQEPPGWRAVGQLPSGIVYENPRALPRAFLVGRSVVLESAEERLKFLSQPSFDGRRIVVLEAPTNAPSGPDEVAGTVQLAAMEPGSYALRADCPVDAYLVLSEAYYPGWTVQVDGAPAALLRADHLLQAVRLPAGAHDVRFSYRSRFLGPGFALAALVPLGILAFWKWGRRRS